MNTKKGLVKTINIKNLQNSPLFVANLFQLTKRNKVAYLQRVLQRKAYVCRDMHMHAERCKSK